jgi:hypothetical protein
MSTHCALIVKVKESDLRKTMSSGLNNLPKAKRDSSVKGRFLNDWNDYGENGNVNLTEPTLIGRKYMGIYVHWDGYPDWMLRTLSGHWNTYKDALNIVLSGDCSSIDKNSIRRYADRSGEEWKYLKPKQADTINGVVSHIDCEYAYLFEDGEWREVPIR